MWDALFFFLFPPPFFRKSSRLFTTCLRGAFQLLLLLLLPSLPREMAKAKEGERVVSCLYLPSWLSSSFPSFTTAQNLGCLLLLLSKSSSLLLSLSLSLSLIRPGTVAKSRKERKEERTSLFPSLSFLSLLHIRSLFWEAPPLFCMHLFIRPCSLPLSLIANPPCLPAFHHF